MRLADGSTLAYDRLVLSPGIDLKYDSVPGWGEAHEEVMPHAWKAGKQTEIHQGVFASQEDLATAVRRYALGESVPPGS